MIYTDNNINRRSFKHLSLEKRGILEQMIEEGKYNQQEMANIIGVSQSTISRKIKRGQVE